MTLRNKVILPAPKPSWAASRAPARPASASPTRSRARLSRVVNRAYGAANVPGLEQPEQHRLGIAVGQRAANETFNVRIEGIRVCAYHPERWPDAYREGVVQGLFINEDGQAHAHAAASADCAAELLRHHSTPERVLTGLSAVLAAASWSLAFQQNHVEILTAMKDARAKMPSQAKTIWTSIIAELETRAPQGDR